MTFQRRFYGFNEGACECRHCGDASVGVLLVEAERLLNWYEARPRTMAKSTRTRVDLFSPNAPTRKWRKHALHFHVP